MSKINIGGGAIVAVAGLLAVGGAAYFLKKKGGAVLDKINPASDKNLAYSGVNALGEWVTNTPDWALGSAAYELLNESSYASDAKGMTVTKSDGTVLASATAQQIRENNANPTNMGGLGSIKLAPEWYSGLGYQMESWEKDDPFGVAPAPETKYSNPVSNAVNYVGGKVAGDNSWTLGGWLYDITH